MHKEGLPMQDLKLTAIDISIYTCDFGSVTHVRECSRGIDACATVTGLENKCSLNI